jgi:hypothetical protein
MLLWTMNGKGRLVLSDSKDDWYCLIKIYNHQTKQPKEITPIINGEGV